MNLLGKLACAFGFHSWRIRKNGSASERVCMRPGCDKKEKLYRLKNGSYVIWNGTKIPVRHSSYEKIQKGGKKC